MDPTSTTLTEPQLCAWVPESQASPGGLPATYKVVPFSRPIVAPPVTVPLLSGSGVPGTLVFISSGVTLTWLPPHSGPQFSTYAVLSSPLNTAHTGRSEERRVGKECSARRKRIS